MIVKTLIVNLIGLRNFLGVLGVAVRIFPDILDHEGCILISV